MMTVAEAADHLRCRKAHIYSLMRSGRLEGSVGRHRLVPASEIRRLTKHGVG